MPCCDNLIDVVVRPGAGTGSKPSVTFRPKVSPYSLDPVMKDLQTGPAGSETTAFAIVSADGRIAVVGSVPAGGADLVRTVPVADAATFGRTAFIEALGRAGVQVQVPAVAANRTDLLPAVGVGYPGGVRVAAFDSPPYGEAAKFILLTSHNPGANLNICLLALKAGSRNCSKGFPLVRQFLERVGLDLDEVVLTAPDGGSEANRSTTRAITKLLGWWLGEPDGQRFRQAMAQPGVVGAEAGELKDSPARGHISGKSGLRVQGDQLNLRPFAMGSGYVGYLDLGGGRTAAFAIYVDDALAADTAAAVRVLDDLVAMSAAFWVDLQAGR